MRTGVIGLGGMGAPMARNLQRNGLLETVWNRTRSTAEALAEELGVPAAFDPAELADRCEVIILSVSADDDVLEVVGALVTSLWPGAVVIDTSTDSRETARAAAAQVAAAGGNFLDAPVSGGVEGARQGTLAMMVGGDAAVLARVQPVLEAVAARITHMGPVGAGQATKAVNQIMAAGINQAVTEALAFGQAQGLPTDQLIAALEKGAAGNWFLSHRGKTMVRGEFPLGFKVALHAKDLEICRQMAGALGARLPVVEMTLVHYARLLADGSTEEDISALFRLKSDMFSGGGG